MFTDVQPDPSKYDLEADKYIVRVVKLEATDHEKYGAGVRWIFNVAHRGNPPAPIYDTDGEKLELWQTTNPQLTPGTKAGLWAAALLNRPIAVGESGQKIADELIGKYGLALYGVNPRSPEHKKGILSIEPYTNGNGKVAAVAAPAADPLGGGADDF